MKYLHVSQHNEVVIERRDAAHEEVGLEGRYDDDAALAAGAARAAHHADLDAVRPPTSTHTSIRYCKCPRGYINGRPKTMCARIRELQ